MEKSTFVTPHPSSVQQPVPAPSGPVEIDPRLFALVSGGAPRDNGWNVANAAPSATSLG